MEKTKEICNVQDLDTFVVAVYKYIRNREHKGCRANPKVSAYILRGLSFGVFAVLVGADACSLTETF